MSDLEILNSIREITGEKNASADEVMSAHTTFRVGGPADYLRVLLMQIRLRGL